VKGRLRQVGLRPTRQRVELASILFAKGNRHVTAEMLYEEATRAKVPVSLATVYNTLHQFTEFGLLRQVAVDASKTYFDTNNSAHHHFFIEDNNELIDIPMSTTMLLGETPIPPEGYEIARIDVVVRLRRKQGCPDHLTDHEVFYLALGVQRLLTLNDVLRWRSEVERAGSQRAFARKAGVNDSVVSKTLRRMVLPSEKILSA